MRIGVDIDGVLYIFEDALRDYLLERWAPGLDFPAPTTWNFYEEWGLTRDDFNSLCHEAVNAGCLFWKGKPYPGVGDALRRLRDAGHEIILITARGYGSDHNSERATLDWLDDHDLPYHELHFSSDKSGFAVDYMIDDKAETFLALRDDADGPEAWLMDRPWNQHVETFYRVHSLAEYVDLILNDDKGRAEDDEVTVTSATGGQKGKKLARYDLIPPAALRQVAELYGRGAEKYSDHNWRNGYDWSLSFAAMQRHSWQFWNGEEYDEETGCAHLTSVIFHALSLLTFMEEQRGYDDRFANLRSEGLATPTKGLRPPEACEAPTEAPAASQEHSCPCQTVIGGLPGYDFKGRPITTNHPIM